MSGTVQSYNITSANVVFLLSIGLLYPTPQQLQGFSPDDMFETEEADIAEVQMGADGQVAAGWVPNLFKETIRLLASSPSCRMFDDLYAAQSASRSIYPLTGTVYLGGLKSKVSRQNGTMTRYAPYAPAKKVFEYRTFEITWGNSSLAVL